MEDKNQKLEYTVPTLVELFAVSGVVRGYTERDYNTDDEPGFDDDDPENNN